MDRVTPDAQSDHHWQPLGEVLRLLVDVFLWQLLPYSLQDSFKPISCHRLRLVFMVICQHGATNMIVQWVHIWRD